MTNDDAILANLFRRVLTSDFYVLLEPVSGDRYRFCIDGSIYDLSDEERAAVERVYDEKERV